MIALAALMMARTRAGAPVGMAARPLRRIIAVLPATVGVFETGSAGIEFHGLSCCGALTGGDWFQTDGVSGALPWLGSQPCGCGAGAGAGSWAGGVQVWSWLSPSFQWWCAE